MPAMHEMALKKELDAGRLAPVYLLFGNDAYLKQNYLKRIIRKTVSEDDCFNFQQFSGDCDLQDVYDAVQQLPLMAERKCVVLSDYDYEKADKASFQKLLVLLEEAVDSAVLVLFFDWVEVELKSEKTKKLIAAVEKPGGRAVLLDHRQKSDLVRMLCSGASRRGCQMDPSTARYLIETVSDDLNLLKSELEKLTAYCAGKPITPQAIDFVCVKTVESSVYNISKELLSGNLAGAMALLDELFLLRTEPVLILSILSGAYVDLYKAKAASDAGRRPEQCAAELGYKGREFVLARAERQLRQFDDVKLEKSLSAFLQADTALKSSSADARTILEELLVRLLAIARRGEDID